MSSKILFNTLLTISFIIQGCSIDAIENSIIPRVETFECIENLPLNKYSDNQFKEIAQALQYKNEKIRFVSYNVLFNDYDHNLDEVNRWPQRLPRVVELFEEMQPDVIGIQELYPDQLQDLLPHIEETYAFYSRPISKERTELCGIFYRKNRFELVDGKVFYMSDTPNVPSHSTLTMVELKDLKTDKLFCVFNTHLSFSGVNKRDFQARFIAKQARLISKQMPVLFAGDLNTFPNRLDLEKLPFLDGDHVHRILSQGSLRDSKDCSLLGHLGPISTFTNAENDVKAFEGVGTPGVMLDHIYVSKDVTVLIHAVQPATVDGHFPSDHMPVFIDFVLDR